MTPKPTDPADFRPLALGRTADILEEHGWWFRYRVHRLNGIGIPENGVSSHRTLEGARRAARRWCSKNSSGEHVETVRERGAPPPPPPPKTAGVENVGRVTPVQGGAMPATAPDNVIAKRDSM